MRVVGILLVVAPMVAAFMATTQLPHRSGVSLRAEESTEEAVSQPSSDTSATTTAPPPPPPPPAPTPTSFQTSELVGATAPFGFFDPLGISSKISEKRAMYYREAEIKHGRVAMLAALGFPVAEQFHPLFGGNVDVPSYVAFQQTPLQTFWPIVVLYIGVIEIFSVFTFENPFEGNYWTISSKHLPGDFDFDPLDLKPSDPKEYEEMQCKELNNGRLAMIGIAGMVVQELVSGNKLFF